ncbi:vasopressin V1b receptor, partial [Brachionus plicatilis]
MFNITHMSQNRSFNDLVDQNLLKIEVFTMSLVFTLAVIGNTVVILTLTFGHLIKPKKSRVKHIAKLSRMNFYILHLSIADIYVSFGNILTMLIWRKNNNLFFGGDLTCRLVVYFQLVSVYYSTYVLMAMTIDRYEAICRPFLGLSWSRQRGLLYITIAFIISHLQGLPQIYFFRLQEIPGLNVPVVTCYAVFKPLVLQNIYIIYTWVMQFLIPICIIIGCYATISIKVFNSIKGKSESNKFRSTFVAKNTSENSSGLVGADKSNFERSKTVNINSNSYCNSARTEYECLTGYEFIKDQTKKNILSNNGELMQKFTCKPQGCKDSASPSSASIDASLNIEYVSKYCDPAYLPGYCKPESSHVDFRCKEGFSIDERFGFLRVKCLTSYLWDTVPMCKRGKPITVFPCSIMQRHNLEHIIGAGAILNL